MEVIMEEKLFINQSTEQQKKAYQKPVMNKIRLVAEEAVLALCKHNNGNRDQCGVNPSCSRVRRS